ncbi:hypothetical protein [Rhizobium sp. RAF56]|uniref:hypothetical protein n=1 Tax=Rhizobium sp. RAF56 TaxID=3233062 RepID=UPI003F9CAFCA
MQHGGPQGNKFNTAADLRADLSEAAMEAEEGGVEGLAAAPSYEAEHAELAKLRAQIAELRKELLATRLRARAVIRSEAGYLNASAHAQLGDYPWVKLSAAAAAAFAVGRLLRGVPILSLASFLLVNRETSTRR